MNDGLLRGRSANSVINASASILSQIIIILLNFIARTIFIKFLSTEYLGLNGLFTNILTVLSFSELGIGEAMVFAMYKPYRENDEDKLCQLMKLYKKAYCLIAVIVFVIGLVISFFLDYVVSEKPNIPENFQIIFLIYLLNTSISYLLTYKKSILLVAQKRFIVVFYQLTFSIVQLIVQALILFILRNFIIYLMCQVLCTFLGNVLISLHVNKKYPYILQKRGRLSKSECNDIFSNVKALAVTKIAGVVGSGTDNIIASKMIGLTTVGLASNYTLITNAANSLLWSVLNGITNVIGDFNVDSTFERRRKIFGELYLCSYWIFAFCGIAIITLINPLIELWLGQSFVLSSYVAFWLVFGIFIGGMNYPAYSFRISLGYFKQVRIYYIMYAILNVGLSIWWAKIWGIVGIFAATSISRLLTAEVADGFYVYKYGLNLNPLKYYLKDLFSIVSFSLSTLICCKVIGMISIIGIFGFVIKTIVCILLSNGLIILSIFWMPAFSEVINHGKLLVKKIKHR